MKLINKKIPSCDNEFKVIEILDFYLFVYFSDMGSQESFYKTSSNKNMGIWIDKKYKINIGIY